MAKHWCLNGTMVNTDSYSSPLPFIGLYTAAASLVCFILMLCDLCIGLRRRKYWFPCRFFPLNSVTLTLISVATKIPVDLTTAMPRAEDQLCKLTGTVFICICMSFMAPSIGSHEEFDSYANVTALSIFVITVVVNICIQIATGVIFSFIVEHFLILFSMLLLLTRFWLSVVAINGFKNTCQNKDLIETGEESMSERLKVCYLHGYNSCPQFVSCRGPYVSGGASFSVGFSFTLIQAMLRSLVFKDFRFLLFKELRFCVGVSDYGWSTWLIMVIQILAAVVVSLAIGIRWLIYAVHVMDGLGVTDGKPSYDSYVQFLYLFSLKNLPKSLEKSFKVLVYYPLYSIDLLMKLLNKTVAAFICMVVKKCCMHEDEDADADESMKGVVLLLKSQEVMIEEWILRKGVDDMETWMKKSRKDFPNHLIKLLSTIPRRQESNKMSCLSMLIFAEIAEVFAPDSITASLTEVIGEVFEIIHFIEDITDVADYYNRLKSRYAQVICKFGLIDEVVDKEMVEKTMNEVVQPHFSSDHALKIFQQSFLRTGLRYEAHEIVNLIHWWSFATSKELYDHMEHLFVDMLHAFLSQLPNAIFKHIRESPIGEYENRVRYCLGLICKLESLESYLQLPFPPESSLTSLSNYNTRSNVPVEGNIPVIIATATASEC